MITNVWEVVNGTAFDRKTTRCRYFLFTLYDLSLEGCTHTNIFSIAIKVKEISFLGENLYKAHY